VVITEADSVPIFFLDTYKNQAVSFALLCSIANAPQVYGHSINLQKISALNITTQHILTTFHAQGYP
jgi:hypothetical protein